MTTATSAAPDTPAAPTLEALRAELASVTAEAEDVTAALRLAYETNDQGAVPDLRARHNALWARQRSLVDDVAMAETAARRRAEAEGSDALVHDFADLEARMVAHGATLAGLARSAADAWARHEALWREHRALTQRRAMHHRTYGSTPPVGFDPAGALGVTSRFLAALERLTTAAAALPARPQPTDPD